MRWREKTNNTYKKRNTKIKKRKKSTETNFPTTNKKERDQERKMNLRKRIRTYKIQKTAGVPKNQVNIQK